MQFQAATTFPLVSRLRGGLGLITGYQGNGVDFSNMAHKYDLLLVNTKTDDKKRLKPWYVNISTVRNYP